MRIQSTPSATPVFFVVISVIATTTGCYSGFDAPTCNELADCPTTATACHAGYCVSTNPPEDEPAEDIVDEDDLLSHEIPVACTESIDLKGCDRWSLSLVGKPVAHPAVFNGFLYGLYSHEDNMTLAAVDVSLGSLSWETPLSLTNPRCVLVNDDGKIAVSGDDGICDFTSDGEEAGCWMTDGTLVGCPVALPEGNLVVAMTTPLGGGDAVSIRESEEEWRSPLEAPPLPSPIHLTTTLAIPLHNGYVALLAPSTGTPIGTLSMTGDLTGNLAGDQETLWTLTQKDDLTTLHQHTLPTENEESEQSVLSFKPTGALLLRSASSPILAGINGYIYTPSLEDGASPRVSLAPQISVGGNVTSALITSDENLVLLDAQSGVIRAFSPQGGLMWSASVGTTGGLGKAYMTLFGNWILIATEGGHLHGIQLPNVEGLSTSAPWPMERKNAQNAGG